MGEIGRFPCAFRGHGGDRGKAHWVCEDVLIAVDFRRNEGGVFNPCLLEELDALVVWIRVGQTMPCEGVEKRYEEPQLDEVRGDGDCYHNGGFALVLLHHERLRPFLFGESDVLYSSGDTESASTHFVQGEASAHLDRKSRVGAHLIVPDGRLVFSCCAQLDINAFGIGPEGVLEQIVD